MVVAMSSYQAPKLPAFARDLNPDVVQMHSSDYRSPQQLREGPVLVVGGGNSGAEIAFELVRSHRVVMSGRDTGHVPFRVDSALARVLLPILFRVVFHRVLTVKTPMGRRVRSKRSSTSVTSRHLSAPPTGKRSLQTPPPATSVVCRTTTS